MKNANNEHSEDNQLGKRRLREAYATKRAYKIQDLVGSQNGKSETFIRSNQIRFFIQWKQIDKTRVNNGSCKKKQLLGYPILKKKSKIKRKK